MRVHRPLAPTTTGPLPEHVLEQVAADLEAAATARENQLMNLPPATTPVAAAHHQSVRRILGAIRSAQAELAAGTYGDCRRCGRRASAATDLTRPWTPQCDTCSRS
jgi:RNA polymerase-binding transcription factor DksA